MSLNNQYSMFSCFTFVEKISMENVVVAWQKSPKNVKNNLEVLKCEVGEKDHGRILLCNTEKLL